MNESSEKVEKRVMMLESNILILGVLFNIFKIFLFKERAIEG